MMRKELGQAKKVFEEELEKAGLELISLLLFGSRATGDFNQDSDWDFLLIIDQDLERKQKWELILKMKRKLAKLRIPNDIIIESEKRLGQKARDPGHIAHYALKQAAKI